ncbi:sn-glycerol-3-phosphate ABC transporter ATP-binding protein UgpC [Mesorhizobium sp.]|uniref:ABC transporter ATP-binding protein n=1 Tax=Mesorhizobium sp. TaxID=1871066 RepID=UPI000FE3F34D|nr:sn-glycerol-3-phosphate ABC transporter ATP-binding protein UgpC [Mesorhizobium sp.]RWH72460.1 MAG: sn-glycerol-3-phosphate ABC transporter ATP-binding protein UgpC [Mesorhizobium sp.]RWL34656.1 MAG: sn-glycerol-3-phosphate ABC transporter ATP-binding protein UgpC [Mesorhizobium sp.]RWL36069.1 MAG: sn-glycerol-3-phosphate ABC transporter ATP-binding protein UgpC [Mesorhizobium sp.]RWL41480.1 MAG: sn-glycerol-3-phosphate ABC transporter ATP-binding protein UgpC [Mesorhizobium sp.]RWL50638.1 
MSELQIRDVHKKYGVLEVIHSISLDVADGEFIALVGPSGCGKSTLLRLIAGLEEITSGEISIGGRAVNRLAPKQRDIAMVFQTYALYPHMNVEDNMSFSLRLAKVGEKERQERVGKAAEILGLQPYLKRYPRQLSGGQRQRVAMGRAIVRDPAIYLFDEPLSNLDSKLRVAMRSEIKENHQRLKTTTVYVTHDQIEAMTMADRIVVLNGGRIEQVGAPLDLYDKPDNLFVASFIGSPAMNFIEGTIRGGDFLAADGTAIPVGFSLPGDGRPLQLGIRPEHLRLSAEGIALYVRTIEPTGAETLIHGTLAGVPVAAIFRERIAAQPGQSITVSLDVDKTHLFDAATSMRI